MAERVAEYETLWRSLVVKKMEERGVEVALRYSLMARPQTASFSYHSAESMLDFEEYMSWRSYLVDIMRHTLDSRPIILQKFFKFF